MADQRIEMSVTSTSGSELDNLRSVLADGAMTTGGPFSRRARNILDEMHLGARSVLTTSCTSALHLAAISLGLGEGDEVIVPSYAFVSTAAAFELVGARPIIVDVEPTTLGLDPAAVERAIGPRTRAVCVIHYGGIAARITELSDMATAHGLALVEDNAHGLGGEAHGRPLGTFGALSALSFDSQKNITCGEGGALVVNDLDLWPAVEVAKERGTNKARFQRGEVRRYEWSGRGSNWDMGELAAAVLVAQLEDIDHIQTARHAVWGAYLRELGPWASTLGVRLPVPPEHGLHTAHIFHLRFASAADLDRFILHMDARGITVSPHYHALNTSAMGRMFGGAEGQCPVAEETARTLVRLPLHRGLSALDVQRVVDAVTSFR